MSGCCRKFPLNSSPQNMSGWYWFLGGSAILRVVEMLTFFAGRRFSYFGYLGRCSFGFRVEPSKEKMASDGGQ